MPRSRSRSTEAASSPRRSRSPLSDHQQDVDQPNEYRLHVAELPPNVEEHELRKMFQRYGTVNDVWIANASCFAFVVYKDKNEAQKAIDALDGKSFGNNRLKVTWARPRTRSRSHRYDPNMRCYKCGQRGHFSRGCDRIPGESRSTHRREHSSSNARRRSRSRPRDSSDDLPAPAYFRHGMPVYPEYSRQSVDSNRDYHSKSNGYNDRSRTRGSRLTPPSTSSRYNRR